MPVPSNFRQDLADEQARRRPILICIPYAGGGSTAFAHWKNALAPQMDVISICFPGRERLYGQTSLTSIAQMAEFVIAQLPQQAEQELLLFGHSMGALVAFEVARTLQARGCSPVKHLLVSACQAPPRFFTQGIASIKDDHEFIQAVTQFGGIPSELASNKDFLEFVTPILRGDFLACDAYAYQATSRLSIPITAFGGISDELVPLPDLQAWQELGSAGFAMHQFDGGHFYLNQYVPQLTQWILQVAAMEAANT